MPPRDRSSESSREPDPKPTRKGWRGDRTPDKKPSRRWQTAASSGRNEAADAQTSKHRFVVAFWSIASLGLIGLLVWLVLMQPKRTPVIVMTATAYDWPFPPNAWAKQDARGFAVLDRDTIDFRDWSDLCGGRGAKFADSLAPLKNRLQELVTGLSPNVVCIYLSMHGAVDSTGAPCLIPPGASPHDAASWMPLRQVLETIKAANVPERTQILLVLDASRIETLWPAGILANTFADGLQQTVEAVHVPNLTVVNSAGIGETAFAGEELQGSAFGRHLLLGFSGEADLRSEGGNGNRRVSLSELENYLKRRVGNWAAEQRNDVQTPILVRSVPDVNGKPAADYDVVAAQGSGLFGQPDKVRKEIEARLARPWERPVAETKLTELWRARQQLRQPEAERVLDPLLTAEIDAKLLWLEQLDSAGPEYQEMATLTASAVDQRLAQAARDPLGDRLAAFSIPLAEHLGWLDRAGAPPTAVASSTSSPAAGSASSTAPAPRASQTQRYLVQASSSWKELLTAPRDLSREMITQALAKIGAAPQAIEPGVIERHFLLMLDRYAEPTLWTSDSARLTARQLLRTRDAAEHAATPADVRSWYWVRSLVDEGDVARRQSEDEFFIGEPSALDRAAELARTADSRYQQATTLGAQVSRALAVRDRGFSELDQLALWLLRPLPAYALAQDVADREAAVRDELLPAIDATLKLADLLATVAVADRPNGTALDRQASTVLRGLSSLRQRFDQTCVSLLEREAEDKPTLREIAAVLQVPLIDADLRSRLRSKLLTIARALEQYQRRAEATDKQPEPPPATSGVATYRRLLLGAGNLHPIVHLIGTQTAAGGASGGPAPMGGSSPSDGGGATSGAASAPGSSSSGVAAAPAAQASAAAVPAGKEGEQLAAQGANLRTLLAEVPRQSQAFVDQALGLLAQSQASWEAHLEMAKGDRLARRAAPLLASPFKISPTIELRRVDLYHLFTWLADRTIDDFWGPEEPSPDVRLSYFVQTGEKYIAAARRLYPTDGRTRLEAVAEVTAELGTRKNALAQALTPTLRDPPLVTQEAERDGDPITLDVSLSLGANLPRGKAALFVGDFKQGSVELEDAGRGFHRRAIDIADIPQIPAPLAFRWRYPLAALTGGSTQRAAVALYRGHVHEQPFVVRRSVEGIELVIRRPELSPPEVTVFSDGTRPGAVVFILDCSDSMEALTTPEGGGAAITRLEVAKQSLLRMLKRLAQAGKFNVAVYLFGHRARWANDPKTKEVIIVRQNSFPQAIPADVLPFADVEAIQPLDGNRTFGLADYAFVEKLLGDKAADGKPAVRPHGITPLYPSLLRVLKDLQPLESESRHTIITITDGRDFQWKPPALEGRFPERTVKDVLQAASGQPVSVNIVGFQIGQDEFRQVSGDFGRIATATQGELIEATSAGALTSALERWLDRGRFEVYTPTKSLVGTSELGLPIKIADFVREAPYQVQVPLGQTRRVASAFKLVGGEKLLMQLSRDREHLEYIRYDQGILDQSSPLEAPGRPTERYIVAAHLPTWQGNVVEFPISIQNAAPTGFSPTPSEVWVEITPIAVYPNGRRERRDPFVIYDLTLKDQRPAPIVLCRIPDWPPEAVLAEIRVASRFEPGNDYKAVRVGDALEPSRLVEPGSAWSYQAEVRRDKEGNGFRVTLKCVPEQGDIYSVRADLSPAAEQITRRFDAKSRVVVHTFYYPQIREEATINSAEIRFTSRDRFYDSALKVTEPLEIRVPEKLKAVGG